MDGMGIFWNILHIKCVHWNFHWKGWDSPLPCEFIYQQDPDCTWHFIDVFGFTEYTAFILSWGLFLVVSFSGSISQNFKVPSMTISDLVYKFGVVQRWKLRITGPLKQLKRRYYAPFYYLNFLRYLNFVAEKHVRKTDSEVIFLKQGGDI